MDSSLAPAGWYPDPHAEVSTQRYWDGASWTSHTAAPSPVEQGPRPVQLGGVVLAAILPGIGVLVGLIMLAKKEPRTGLAMIATSLLSYVFLFQVLPLLLGRSA